MWSSPVPRKAQHYVSSGGSTDALPNVAAHWLVESDSPALRRLAGLNGSEGCLIDQLWPELLADLGVQGVSGEQAWDAPRSLRDLVLRADQVRTAVPPILDAAPPTNPTPVTAESLEALLHAAWEGKERA